MELNTFTLSALFHTVQEQLTYYGVTAEKLFLFIVYVAFWDKSIIFVVQNMILISEIVL